MNQWNAMKSNRKKSKVFAFNHNDLEKAVNEYLKNGGKITKLEANDTNYSAYINSGNSLFLADDFLFGD